MMIIQPVAINLAGAESQMEEAQSQHNLKKAVIPQAL